MALIKITIAVVTKGAAAFYFLIVKITPLFADDLHIV